MLKEILSITGKPGLFRIITPGKRTLLVEDLVSKKRFPLGARDRVVCLGDIAMYTVGEDLPLDQILDRVYAAEEGKNIDVKSMDNDMLRAEFAKAVEDFDRDRVYPSDIKKLFNWYNLLISQGYTKFTEDEPEAAEEKGAAPEE
ncbi:MAG: DUF5606 domain-containing protein [Muribaculaceae bacterium]|nr:DUF5606 domain-containing protein [Muribaculaceae bacterium]MDE6552404.1 DUF5606 domain-containing protein [Muribaculaceae bacterium]